MEMNYSIAFIFFIYFIQRQLYVLVPDKPFLSKQRKAYFYSLDRKSLIKWHNVLCSFCYPYLKTL
jgi:uncharacterized iron-regulated protein